ncbi:polysaccharide deacetylase family protein [Ketogulonicigenium vulgare]|uniref:Polysaccharide deacetylase domain protein n=1 Tax=Ketogulonicigenium vulgare (strain WSH-001) TaxID=759362 RepID=F9Y8Q3_KETVW|nr:polysaccharide deacetylase family protein [Ketogulonicigenium vulgare]ADO43042.1 polysaccharide deacetylase [Ketogulonicigenium vulgare Y25]AEM41222.1 Polysaccharide deacetylase domain protein [Ketogulonicigenium vulgare WSH-001]ALJ81362.1 polysaccharide deacetylase [Ketogulonicigenium vulgare]ANW34094.1 polysaccharide deacetylase [Ketogulonicigenium vulgare]AOZ54953.1 polysaccharide deacetylase [Ketogulonicigenium vulgare]
MSANLQPVPPGYTDYPLRQHAKMDHNLYDWRNSLTQPVLRWPGQQRIGLWVQLAVEWFPLDIAKKPFLPIGAPARPYPDTQTYTQRDYGNRIGIYRLMDAFKAAGITPTAFVNARLAQRYPMLMRDIIAEGYEIAAASLDAGTIHHAGLDIAAERAVILETLDIFKSFELSPRAWHSPSWSQSHHTAQLLVEAGITEMADWPNDELPYPFETPAGQILSLPGAYDLSDRAILIERGNTVADFNDQILRAHRQLQSETETGQHRLLTINLSPWVMGQPYRIAALEKLLQTLVADPATRPVTIADIRGAMLPTHPAE